MSPPAAAVGELVKQVAIPTTFVQTEKECFREVVQKYTGVGDDLQGKLPVTGKPVASSKVDDNPQNGCKDSQPKQMFKLHERRNKSGKEMKLDIKHNTYLFKKNSASPRSSEGLSPTLQERLSSLVSSPVTPLSTLSLESSESFNPRTPVDRFGAENFDVGLEEIKAFGFDRHFQIKSVLSRNSEPELLNLFPLVSLSMSQAEEQ